jgi:hypothetical protein
MCSLWVGRESRFQPLPILGVYLQQAARLNERVQVHRAGAGEDAEGRRPRDHPAASSAAISLSEASGIHAAPRPCARRTPALDGASRRRDGHPPRRAQVGAATDSGAVGGAGTAEDPRCQAAGPPTSRGVATAAASTPAACEAALDLRCLQPARQAAIASSSSSWLRRRAGSVAKRSSSAERVAHHRRERRELGIRRPRDRPRNRSDDDERET